MEKNKIKILAIDDNRDNLISVKALIKEAFPDSIRLTAENGAAGIKLAQAEYPDVILLDVVMPGMDGFEVCQKLKADPKTRDIPVVFLTALKGDKESRIHALEVGGEAFLAKPIDEAELTAQVRAMMKISVANKQKREEKETLTELVAKRTRELELANTATLNLLEDLREENEARKHNEEALRASQQLAESIIESIPGTFYMLDEAGKYVRWSAYQRDEIIGKPDDQIAGFPAIDTIHPDDRALIQARIANVLRTGVVETVEGRVLLRGGPMFQWLLMTGRQLVVAGHPYLVGIGIDISERKQAEEKQSQTFELLTNLARLVPGVIYQYRLYPDGSSAFPYSSPGMYSIYEVTPEQVREDATPVFGRLHPEDADRVSNLIFESARTLEEFYCEFRVILPEQGLRWRWSQAHPERTEDGGTLWHGIISDITERKRVEEKLKENNLKLQLAMQSANMAWWEMDIHSGQVTFEKRKAEMLGYAPEKFHHFNDFVALLHPDDNEKAMDAMRKHIEGSLAKYEVEYRILNTSGEYKWFYDIGAIAKRDLKGNPLNVAGLVMDISERKQVEEALQKSSDELRLAYDSTLHGWSKALELREHETAGHSQRVVDMTLKLAQAMGIRQEELVHIERGALLHDIGKMGIPDSILLKPGPLSEDEWGTMRLHPVFAYQLLSIIPYLEPALDIPHYHHEKWDGSGYPNGLHGKEIPIAARIFAIIDVWDALSYDRPYRKAWTEEAVIQYLKEQSGIHFDPIVVTTFITLIKV